MPHSIESRLEDIEDLLKDQGKKLDELEDKLGDHTEVLERLAALAEESIDRLKDIERELR